MNKTTTIVVALAAIAASALIGSFVAVQPAAADTSFGGGSQFVGGAGACEGVGGLSGTGGTGGPGGPGALGGTGGAGGVGGASTGGTGNGCQ